MQGSVTLAYASPARTFSTATYWIEGSDLHVLGKGASGAHILVQFGDNVFVGDLVNAENHAWLELGFIKEWLACLLETRSLNVAKIYPGRGAVGTADLLESGITETGVRPVYPGWVRGGLEE